jgi:hypothetical protein
MKMKEICELAKRHGIKSFNKSRTSLIHEIQKAEGNFDCFGTATDYCDQDECRFRSICLKIPQQ